MGLKTNNYTTKGTNVFLVEAYAVLRNLIIEKNNSVRAIFAIQTNRENANFSEPLEKVEINFDWDRKTDPAKMAYEYAKTEIKQPEGENGIANELGSLYGWKDDIL
jgi:hypothetical protein